MLLYCNLMIIYRILTNFQLKLNFDFFCRLIESHPVIIKRVSAANNVVLNEEANGILLTYNKKNSRPRIDPCGIPPDMIQDLR